MADATLRAVITAEDRASKVIAGVSSSLDKVKGGLEKMQPAFQKMAVVGTAGSGVIGLIGKTALSAAADYEQSQIAFTTMLGSAEKAQQFLKDLTDFARKTPFELPGLRNASTQLLAYGFAQEEVIPNLKALGDIAAGVGMDKLPNLILAFGQVKAATRLTGMELRQFTEAGVPLLDELSKVMGKPVAEIQKLVSEGQVGFPLVQQALQNLTGEGGKFNNMMEQQSKSFTGMLSNLNDQIGVFLATQGKPLLEFGKEVITRLSGILEKVAAWIEKNPQLAQTIAAVVTGIFALLVVFGTVGLVLPAIITGVQLLGTALMFVAANPIVLLIAALVAMGVALKVAMDKTGGAKEFFRQTWDGIKIIWKEAIDSIVRFFQPLIDKINAVMSRIESLKNAVSSVVSGAGNFVGKALGFRAGGGAVNPNQPYIVGERGPELFTPSTYGSITRSSHLAAGGGIVVNVYGDVSGQELIEKVKRGIMNEIKQNALV